MAVSGDFDRAAMVQALEKLFADWPFRGETPPPIPTDLKPAAPGVYLVDKDVPQGRQLVPGGRVVPLDVPGGFPEQEPHGGLRHPHRA